jgi:8-oxo-dGTP diphosphatase
MSVRIVVGAAIVHDGLVLAARRSAPVELAGGWEFPGGKVEAGESETAALARECAEELGVTIAVRALLGSVPIEVDWQLHLYRADLVAGAPRALQDHDELRWLSAAEIGTVAWLPADRPLLVAVAATLRRLG